MRRASSLLNPRIPRGSYLRGHEKRGENGEDLDSDQTLSDAFSLFLSFRSSSGKELMNDRQAGRHSRSRSLMHWRLGPRVTIITSCTHACPILRDRGAKCTRSFFPLSFSTHADFPRLLNALSLNSFIPPFISFHPTNFLPFPPSLNFTHFYYLISIPYLITFLLLNYLFLYTAREATST